MIGGDRLCNILQQYCLTGTWRRNNQGALTLAQRGDEIEQTGRTILDGRIGQLHAEALFGVKRREIVEVDLVANRLGIFEIDRIDLEQREITLAILGRPDLAFDRVAGAQTEAA